MYKFGNRLRLLIILLCLINVPWGIGACAKNPHESPAPISVTVKELLENAPDHYEEEMFVSGILREVESETYILVDVEQETNGAPAPQLRLMFRSKVDPSKIAPCLNNHSYALGKLTILEPATLDVSYINLEANLKSLSPNKCMNSAGFTEGSIS